MKRIAIALLTIISMAMPSWADSTGGGNASGGGAPTSSTYVTSGDETGTLSNSRQLVDGTNTTIDTSTPGQIKVNASGGGGGGLWSGTTVEINATTDGPTYNVPAGVSQVLVDANNFEDPITIVLPPVSGMTEGTSILIGVNPNFTNPPLVTVEANAADTTAWGIFPNGDYTFNSTAWWNYGTYVFVANPDIDTVGDGYQWMLLPNGDSSPNDLYMQPSTSLKFWPQGSTTNDGYYRLRASTEIPAATRNILIRDSGTSNVQLGMVTNSGGTSGSVPLWIAGSGVGGYLQLNGNLGAGDKRFGTATTSGGTVTVNTTAVSATSLIFLTPQHSSATTCTEDKASRVNGTSFVIKTGADCDVAWMVVEP